MDNAGLQAPHDDSTLPVPERTNTERLLLLFALLIGILFDRLFYAATRQYDPPLLWGIFWLGYLAVFAVFYAKRILRSKILCFITVCSLLLCLWAFFLAENNPAYALVNFAVIPAVLMAHAVLAAGAYTPKDIASIAAAWCAGWLVKPFSGLTALSGSLSSLVRGRSRSVVKRVALGVGIALPLLALLSSLLAGADGVFAYYARRITDASDLRSFTVHSIVTLMSAALFYSFLWNVGFGKKTSVKLPGSAELDTIVCCIVLGAVSLLYILFCAVQFTYLFAGAGLPGGLSYSEYAREGFAQTIAVCAINLALFGLFLRFGVRTKPVKVLLAGLLLLSAVMLVSGSVRLGLYIEAYGLTWLRLLSAWFILYLAAVMLICALRLFWEKLPAVMVCALLLLGWYVALGYSNPGALADHYNRSHGYDREISLRMD